MTTPTVRNPNPLSRSKESASSNSFSLSTRRFAAWATEIALVVVSGLVPFSIGAYANTRSDLNREPLNPVLVITERAIARPLALPTIYGTRNVAWITNFLWTVALLAPLTVSGWQLYLLAKTGSTIPKRWFAVRVVNAEGQPPGFSAVLLREGIGRWTIPMSIAYILWRYTFVYPYLSAFTALAILMILGEGAGFPSKRGSRSLHDRLADTYTIDAKETFTPSLLVDHKKAQSQFTEGDEEAAIASIVITPESKKLGNLWQWIQQNPSLMLFGIAIFSMSAVLTALVGTQIYIQSQDNQRESDLRNSQKFLALQKQLNPNGATPEQRQRAILAMGTMDDQQAINYLSELLVKENDPAMINTIEQALTTIGPKAIPQLTRTNQLLAQLDTHTNTGDQDSRQQHLYNNQQAIKKILAVYNGQTHDLDLSHVQLGTNGFGQNSSSTLVLDKTDLSGINFKYANLNQASLKQTRFRGPGEDGRWDTYDDWVADLSGAQLKQANLTYANLSRVLMIRTDFSRATLNKANLSDARLVGANLSSTQLVQADLEGAVLENASLTGADLGEAKLNDADLYAARLGRVSAVGTQLSFANLTKTDWQGADLSGAYLNRANLSDANLSATSLNGAILRSANLQNANLRNADLSLADLRGANLTGVDLQGAIFTPGKQDPADQFVQKPQTGIQSALIKGVDFTQVKNLDTKQIAYICTQGGIHPRCP